jgi:hypothetical protein
MDDGTTGSVILALDGRNLLFTAAGRFERRSRAVARNDLVVVILSGAAALTGA